MPVLTMSTVTPHVVKNHKRFNKLVNQRTQTHHTMRQIANWKNNVQEKLSTTIQQGWERHNEALQKGLNADGRLADFHHQQGNTSIRGSVGSHKAKMSSPDLNHSDHHLQMTLADAQIETMGENWSLRGDLKIGDLDASVNHTLVPDNIQLSEGFGNGPKASMQGSAELYHLSASASVATDKSAEFGLRLQGNIDASWGGGAGLNADMNQGVGPLNINNLGPKFQGNIELVIDHQNPGMANRSELATIQLQGGQLDANIHWKEIGNVLSNFHPGGIDIV